MSVQKEINELFNWIDDSKLSLSERINFEDDGNDKIYVIDEEAVVESMRNLYFSRSAYDIYCWLKESKYLR